MNMTVCVYLFEPLFPIILGNKYLLLLSNYLGMELLGHMVILCLTLWGTARLFSAAAVPFFNV